MARIVFCMWPLASEINGSLKLARILTKHGHEVTYIGVPDCREIVEKNGHRFVSVLGEWLPHGSLLAEKTDYERVRLNPLARLFRSLTRKKNFEKLLQHLLTTPDNEVEQAIRSIDAQLLVVGAHSSHTSIFGFIAVKLKVKCAYLLQQMLMRPVEGGAGQDAGTKTWGVSLKDRINQVAFELVNINYRKYYREFLEQSNAPLELIDYSNARFPLKVPILYPWPKPFELKNVSHDHLVYIEAGVDLRRSDENFPWERLAPGKPLVYCSFGGMLPLGLKSTRSLLVKVIESMRPLEGCQMVLSLGSYFTESEFTDTPSNVLLVRRAPQIALLEKAALMITHGGSSSVKECILTGVPMVVIPLGYETPEYSARVQHHRLGMACDPSILTSQTLTRMIKRIMKDSSFQRASDRMQTAFRKWEEGEPSVHFLEAYLRADPLEWQEIPAVPSGLLGRRAHTRASERTIPAAVRS